MIRRNTQTWQSLALAALTGALLLTACGGNSTPTPSVDDISTAAVQTYIAQLSTLQALESPTSAPLPSPFPTLPGESTQSVFPTLAIVSPTSGVANGCDNSIYISDVTIPDGSLMTPGQTFVKTWSVKNNGTCDWNTSYRLVFAFGSVMNGTPVSIPQPVPAGQPIQISVNLVAPTSVGNYTGNWKIQNDKGQFFGTILTVVINVVASTATPGTLSLTPTSSASPTHTPPPTATP